MLPLPVLCSSTLRDGLFPPSLTSCGGRFAGYDALALICVLSSLSPPRCLLAQSALPVVDWNESLCISAALASIHLLCKCAGPSLIFDELWSDDDGPCPPPPFPSLFPKKEFFRLFFNSEVELLYLRPLSSLPPLFPPPPSRDFELDLDREFDLLRRDPERS